MNVFSIMSNFETHYHFKRDFQKFDQNTGDKGFIHRTKHHKATQLQEPGTPL